MLQNNLEGFLLAAVVKNYVKLLCSLSFCPFLFTGMVMSGSTTDVYRAIGIDDPSNPNNIYCDSKLSELSHWHIVLLGTAVWYKC